MRILSLFDGMACGMIAMKNAGVDVERYCAYEIDKYAIKAATHNFPEIEECGDVFSADFAGYRGGCDFLIGGSPCQRWSAAQKPDRRETAPNGIGWELFSQYDRALHEAQPRAFIYENNKSMSAEIRQSITDTFGFEPICINSALVSAQTRQRLYWVGIRNEDGSYRKANVEQPEDRGIMLRDVLDGTGKMVRDHSERRWSFLMKPAENDKCFAVTANIRKGVPYNICADPVKIFVLPRQDGEQTQGQAFRVYSADAKAVSLKSNVGGAGAKTGLYAIEDKDASADAYKVENGQITVGDRTYPIKLKDGFYRIRKLTVDECKRLQTVPDWYDFSCVSASQAYKMLGNGWTCDVITHLINVCLKELNGEIHE